MASLFNRGRPSKQEPPSKAGDYRWTNKETGDVDYYGTTNDLKRRRGEHDRSDSPFGLDTHDFEWKKSDGRFSDEKRYEHEREKIKQHDPTYNKRAGGGGRR